VSDFLDVPGASGARYRFRRAALNDLPVGAGNVVAIAGDPAQPRFLVCGEARSLARAAQALGHALSGAPSARLFIRLNVGRTVRETEHADIVAAVQPDRALTDLG
jgi:hypothetical protein